MALNAEQLKTIRLGFDHVREHGKLRADQFRRFQAGELSEKVATAFLRWLSRAIATGEVVPIEPGLFSKGLNFGRAVVADVKRKGVRVSKEVRSARMEICRACELYNSEKGTCRHPKCGCVMTRKSRWASAFCPIGKWGEDFSGGK